MILRTIKCDICGKEETETAPNGGWDGWGALHGISWNGVANPNLCPEHLKTVADYLDSISSIDAEFNK